MRGKLREALIPLLMVFVCGGIFGFVYEELFYRIDLGYFVKRGSTLGPWIPIYGFGAVLIVLATERLRRKPFLLFLAAAVLTGLLEFVTGYVLFHGLQVRLWDYNVEIWNWMNIGGYVCLRSVLFFGASALLLQYVLHPAFVRLYQKYGRRTAWVTGGLALLFAVDICGAAVRLSGGYLG